MRGDDVDTRGVTVAALLAVDPLGLGGALVRAPSPDHARRWVSRLAALLPEVEVVKECRFGCDPNSSVTWCTECRERNYTTKKNKRNDPERMTLKKFCPRCRTHHEHRETKISGQG